MNALHRPAPLAAESSSSTELRAAAAAASKSRFQSIVAPLPSIDASPMTASSPRAGLAIDHPSNRSAKSFSAAAAASADNGNMLPSALKRGHSILLGVSADDNSAAAKSAVDADVDEDYQNATDHTKQHKRRKSVRQDILRSTSFAIVKESFTIYFVHCSFGRLPNAKWKVGNVLCRCLQCAAEDPEGRGVQRSKSTYYRHRHESRATSSDSDSDSDLDQSMQERKSNNVEPEAGAGADADALPGFDDHDFGFGDMDDGLPPGPGPVDDLPPDNGESEDDHDVGIMDIAAPSSASSSDDEEIRPVPPPPGFDAAPRVVVDPAPPPSTPPGPALPRPLGRPPMRNPLGDPVFEGESEFTQGEFLNDLFQLNNAFNTSERYRKALHEVLQKFVSKQFPSYDRSVKMMRNKMKEPEKYLVCPTDDYIHRIQIDKLPRDNEGRILCVRCPTCHENMHDDEGKPKKVSPQCVTM